MSIRIKYFASLRERLGRADESMHITDTLTVAALWMRITGSVYQPGEILAAVNQQYAQAGTQVQDGDEVAFFPPVTGG